MHNIVFNTDSVEISDMVLKFFVWSWLLVLNFRCSIVEWSNNTQKCVSRTCYHILELTYELLQVYKFTYVPF